MPRHPLALVLLAALAAAPAPAASAGPRAAAVKDVVWRGSGAPDRPFLAMVSAWIRAATAQELRGRYRVVTPDDVDDALRGRGRREALEACSDAACARELGRLAGAELVISGTVAEADGALRLTVEAQEVESGRVLATDTARARRKLELVDNAFELTQALLRRALQGRAARPAVPGAFEDERPVAIAPSADEVVVRFESEPGGASVRLDGLVLCPQTPCRRRVAPGPHEVIFQKERFAPSTQRFRATPGGNVHVALVSRLAWISVQTTPPGIGVAVDGAPAGRSPLEAHPVDAGIVEVAVADPCYLRAGERVALEPGERLMVRIAGKPRLAGLKVNAEDRNGDAVDAPVSVDGAVAGAAGATLQVPVCARRVSVPLGAEVFDAPLRLAEGTVTVVVARPGAARDDPATKGMVRLPGGRYPAADGRAMTVAPFLLDTTEVTVAAYAACLRAGKCGNPDTNMNCNWGRADRAEHPVNCVEWSQARAYCAWAGKRLPTEAEWEWAARGAERGSPYPWGDAPPREQPCWDGGDLPRRARGLGTCTVGSRPAGDSPQGIKDLAGNVAEWTADDGDPAVRPVRGGGWSNEGDASVRADHRRLLAPEDRVDLVGFRCARTP